MNREVYKYLYNKGTRIQHIAFFSDKEETDYAVFSQWFESDFKRGEIWYSTMEQYMMSRKAALFGDAQMYAKILKEKNPAEIKKMGRLVKGFNQAIWDAEKYSIVLEGNVLKFAQNEQLKKILLSTGNRVLIEASPYDKIWGVHMPADNPNIMDPNLWEGENLLGFALMEARNILKNL